MSTRRFLRVDSRSASEMFGLPPNSRSSAFSRARPPRRPLVAGLRTSSTGGASTKSSPSPSLSTKSGSPTRRLFLSAARSTSFWRRSTSSALTDAALPASLRGRPGLPGALAAAAAGRAGALAAALAGVALAVVALAVVVFAVVALVPAALATPGFVAAGLVAAGLVAPALPTATLAAGLDFRVAGLATGALAALGLAAGLAADALVDLPAAAAGLAVALAAGLPVADFAVAGLAVVFAAGLLAGFAAGLAAGLLAALAGAGFTEAFEAALPAAFATAPAFVALPVDVALPVELAAAFAASFSAAALASAPLACFASGFCRPAREEALEVSFFVATDLPLGRTGLAPVARPEFVCPSMIAMDSGRARRLDFESRAGQHGSQDAIRQASKVRPMQGGIVPCGFGQGLFALCTSGRGNFLFYQVCRANAISS